MEAPPENIKKTLDDLADMASKFRLAVSQVTCAYGAASDTDLIKVLSDERFSPVQSLLKIGDELHKTSGAILTAIALMNDRQRFIHKSRQKSN